MHKTGYLEGFGREKRIGYCRSHHHPQGERQVAHRPVRWQLPYYGSPTTTVLVFSSVGFNTQEVSIDGRSVIDVSLSVNTSTLGDVVIIGYGTARKKTSPVRFLRSRPGLCEGPTTSPEQLIMGKVPGVQITREAVCMPGAGPHPDRAGTSLNASNDPLIVIDGYPGQWRYFRRFQCLALINPNGIDNITVLKDASAAAIYGNRAANGVIIITTKRFGRTITG